MASSSGSYYRNPHGTGFEFHLAITIVSYRYIPVFSLIESEAKAQE